MDVEFKSLIFALVFMGIVIYIPTVSATPTIQFGSADPNPDFHVNGNVLFSIVVSDSSEKPTVKMYIDDTYIGTMVTTSSSSPYIYRLPVNTTGFEDGYHNIRYEAYDSGGEDAKSYQYFFDNSAPLVENVTVHYPQNFLALSSGDGVFITAHIRDVTGVNRTTINASSVGISSDIRMYDDGNHNDGRENDEIYGSDFFYSSGSTGVYYLNLSVNDTLGNEGSYWIEIHIDGSYPVILKASVIYPPGQEAIKVGDEFRLIAEIRDQVQNGVGGIKSAWIDCGSLGYDEMIGLFDDGKHMDANPSDGIYGTESLVLRDKIDGLKYVIIYAEDIAGNTQSYNVQIMVDTFQPEISEIKVIYPSGQSWVEDGQNVSFLVNATDSGSGIAEVVMNASEIGSYSHLQLNPGGDYFESGNITVDSGYKTGFVKIKFAAYDNAGNRVERYGYVRLNNSQESDDGDGNTSERDLPPVINGVSVHDEDILSGAVRVSISADDDKGIEENPIVYVDAKPIPMTYGGDDEYYVDINTANYDDGNHVLTFRVEDSSGQYATLTVNVVVDNSPPQVNILQEISDTIRGKVRFSVYALDSSGLAYVSLIVDNASFYANTDGEGWYYVEMDTSILSDGDHAYYFMAVDNAGFMGTTEIFRFRVDNTAPTITYEGKDRVEENETVSFTVGDSVAAWIRIDGGEWIRVNIENSTVSIVPGNLVSGKGEHYMEVKVIDEAGNEGIYSQKVYVEMSEEEGRDNMLVTQPQKSEDNTALIIVGATTLILAIGIILLIFRRSYSGK